MVKGKCTVTFLFLFVLQRKSVSSEKIKGKCTMIDNNKKMWLLLPGKMWNNLKIDM